MKCLVTGATGFLGTNIVVELVKQGWEVRASGSRPNGTPYLQALQVEYVAADITNPDDCKNLADGCEVVFHVAGDTSFWKRQYARQRQINVEGTRNIANACVAAGVKRLIHTSTADVFGYSEDGEPVTEGHPFNYNNMGYNYGETKVEGDQVALSYQSENLDVVLIHPGFMVGPYDHTLQVGRMFFELKEGKVPAYPPGGSSFCHGAEVAKAHINAVEKGRAGESYICAGMPFSNLPFSDFFGQMADAVHAKRPSITLPYWAWIAYAYVSEWFGNLSNQAPQINPGQARYMGRPQMYDSSKAIRELDYVVPPVADCINDALTWYRNNGYEL